MFFFVFLFILLEAEDLLFFWVSIASSRALTTFKKCFEPSREVPLLGPNHAAPLPCECFILKCAFLEILRRLSNNSFHMQS